MSGTGTLPAEPAQDEGPRKHLFMCVWCGGNIEVEDETEAEVALEALRLHHLECEEMPLRRRLEAAHSVLSDFDEFGHPIQPDAPLPPLADRLHGVLAELCHRLEAAESVVEAGRHYRNDYGARDLDEAIREYDKVNS